MTWPRAPAADRERARPRWCSRCREPGRRTSRSGERAPVSTLLEQLDEGPSGAEHPGSLVSELRATAFNRHGEAVR